jgi:hypothetical protein
MYRKKKLNTKMCDVVFASMLVVLCKKLLSDECEWLYAYNQTNNHSRICHKYSIKYYVETYDEKLFDDLASEFKFQWMDQYPKGCSFVYSAKSHEEVLAKFKKKKYITCFSSSIAAIATISTFCSEYINSLAIKCFSMG